MSEAQTVDQAIHAVKASLALNGIAKEGRNAEQKYNFRGVDQVLNALSGLLVAHRLNVLPRIKHKSTFEAGKTKAGASVHRTIIEADFDLISVDDGSLRTVSAIGEAADSADKSGNKAMSAAYKYAMIFAFCIPTEGMDEGDYDHPEAHRNGNGNGSRQESKREERPADGPSAQDLIAFVDKAKAALKDLGISDADKLNDILTDPDFNRRKDTVKAMNPALFQELDHAIGMAQAAVDDVPY